MTRDKRGKPRRKNQNRIQSAKVGLGVRLRRLRQGGRMDRDALKRELTEQFQQSLDQAMDAVEQAPDGAWISGSEWEIRDLFQKLTAQAYERILQAKLDAAEKSGDFSPSPHREQGKARPGGVDRRRGGSPKT
jgi:hypothetical protein